MTSKASSRRTARLRSWPNGIMPRTADLPALSNFSAPLASETPQAWIDCIGEVLRQTTASMTESALHALMARFRAACVFDPPSVPSRVHPGLLVERTAPRVLLIDEPLADALDKISHVRETQFARMLMQARRAHPRAEFWYARSGQPHDDWLAASYPEIRALPRRIDRRGSLCASLGHFDHVYTVSAAEGMQALLHGVQLHVFGTPYYAGWGFTHDYTRQPERQVSATLSELFEAVFMRLSRHIEPLMLAPGSLESLLSAIEAHRATTRRYADLAQIAGIRFQWWKRPFASPYLSAGGGRLRWTNRMRKLHPGEYAAFWGGRSAKGLPPNTPMVRIEDGFLHSIGLGSDHIAPYSQVIDRTGIYFDASRPSDLTSILNEAMFDAPELSRANALRHEISRLGLTKYNLGRRSPGWRAPAGKEIVLVPGQVADDASIRLGTRGITTVDDLLREVRNQRPDAFIVYKPHPDVLSGNRKGLIEATSLADVVDQEADLISLIEAAHEVHTLSSLSGFEALLRGKTVYTYGLPFYAGWGLTLDALKQPWRKRKLTLDMLTAGVLLRYPIYWDWTLQIFTTPEVIVQRLAVPAARPLKKIRGDRMRPILKTLRWIRNGARHLATRHVK
jgi:capsular polysaccharide export protein